MCWAFKNDLTRVLGPPQQTEKVFAKEPGGLHLGMADRSQSSKELLSMCTELCMNMVGMKQAKALNRTVRETLLKV